MQSVFSPRSSLLPRSLFLPRSQTLNGRQPGVQPSKGGSKRTVAGGQIPSTLASPEAGTADDTGFLAQCQRALGKPRGRVDRDEITAFRPLPGRNAERRDLGVQMAQNALELRVQNGCVLLHKFQRVGLVL